MHLEQVAERAVWAVGRVRPSQMSAVHNRASNKDAQVILVCLSLSLSVSLCLSQPRGRYLYMYVCIYVCIQVHI